MNKQYEFKRIYNHPVTGELMIIENGSECIFNKNGNNICVLHASDKERQKESIECYGEDISSEWCDFEHDCPLEIRWNE